MVVGVVVGVGGAIALAAMALVAWRVWGRKRNSDDDDLMTYGTGYGPVEKREVGSAQGPSRTPFQSTLENYHAPSNVNASSNF